MAEPTITKKDNMRGWVDAHRHHGEEPYIGCPFCHDQFVPVARAAPFQIGSTIWPGTGKLIEEASETGQVLGKLIATGGDRAHWDGTDLAERLTAEVGDLLAAARFLVRHNEELDDVAVQERAERKLALFETWHAEGLADDRGERVG